MALAFNKAKGSAKKGNIESYEYRMGDNKVRFVGGILPRYVYWIEGNNGKKFPMECLAFNRETETFDNAEKDYVQEFFPDLKCTWAYSILCIDPTDDKVKMFNLKRKLLEQIMVTAEDLGDPTDPETGWGIAFKRIKTGPHAFNVEYQLQPLKCKPEPLTDEQKAAIEEMDDVDKLLPRPTPENQKTFLEKLVANSSEGEDQVDEEVEDEFDVE